MNKQLYTVYIFSKLNTRRFFRDKLALFFGIAFPLIFLFVFGSIFSGSGGTSFKVALLNNSKTAYSQTFVQQTSKDDVFKIDKEVTTFSEANNKMSQDQLDATIVVPASFGVTNNGIPSGDVLVYYTENNQSAGQTIVPILQSQLKGMNAHFVPIKLPFNASGSQINQKSLTEFDYTFSGLLGFSIIGLGIFGPINVFPELKKQGILRRFHTTPIRVWQYFVSMVISQAIIGLISIGIMFAVAISVFHLKVTGNYFEIAIYVVLSIITILGIGLALGGWAKNERQAAPLSNIIVFPMLFLSGTFFPRYLMPEWLQTVSTYLPLTPVIDGLRLLTTEGKHLVNLGPQLGLMGLWIIVIYLIAFSVFRWE